MDSREEHLDWCKKRALEYVERGDLAGAFTSFQSDMREHKGTADHIALPLMAQLYFCQHLGTREKMQNFIEGFN